MYGGQVTESERVSDISGYMHYFKKTLSHHNSQELHEPTMK